MRRAILVILSTTLIITSTPKAQANPAVAAPALCATGVGCVLVGTVLIGGVAYYVWQHRETGRKTYTRTYDRPGDSGEWDEPIGGGISPQMAERRCRKLASQYKVKLLRVVWVKGEKQYRCYFGGSNG